MRLVDGFDSRISCQFVQNLLGLIRRTIIDNDDLYRLEGLTQEALHCRTEVAFSVVDGHHDGNQGNVGDVEGAKASQGPAERLFCYVPDAIFWQVVGKVVAAPGQGPAQALYVRAHNCAVFLPP